MRTIEQELTILGIDFRASTGDTVTLRKLNKIMRNRDESNLWPICNRYNATERAIRKYRRVYFASSGHVSALEYCLGIEQIISDYVNGRQSD